MSIKQEQLGRTDGGGSLVDGHEDSQRDRSRELHGEE